MTRSVIVSAVRTPFGRLGGSLADKPATELGSIVIKAGLERAGVEPDEVEYVIMGQVLQAGAGQAPARQAAIGAGVPKEVPRDTSVEKLSALKPVFDPEGTTTAGNAPGVNDGASCVVVTSEEYALRRGLTVLARIVSQAYVADDFAYLARTPARAGHRALEKAGKSIGDVKRVEINEAFSSVALNSTRMLGADEEVVNVNGGAVALGHPIGASGGRIVGTMVHELRRADGGLGLAAICSGGGQGDALLIEV